MPTYETTSGTIEFQREGTGRYRAYLLRTGPGRVYLGQVLGGNRVWTAELVGRRVPMRADSRPSLARLISAWAAEQSGVQGASGAPSNRSQKAAG